MSPAQMKKTKMDLISYGNGNKLNINKFNKIKNQKYRNKPLGGLWASPVKTKYGWKEWCIDEQWGDLNSSFIFQIIGKILKINSYNDFIHKMPIIKKGSFTTEINFLLLLRQGIDAIWLTEKGEKQTRFSKPSLYGWDCECVLILNKNCIIKEK